MKPYNKRWKKCYLNEKSHLEEVLKKCKIDSIEHIGATSGVFCGTFGTIDLLLAVKDIVEMSTVETVLRSSGYCFLLNSSTKEMPVFYRRREGKGIVCTVRIVVSASLEYQKVMGFKYYLNDSIKNVAKYNEFRETLMERCCGDYKAYNSIKLNYINSILDECCKFN